eukprot:TRINITY_DN10278_c0_g1_i1.p1 TRINITY_DN10278_c0_g1~~TRINITY_DN10278_c0_g1_i1.p1  ORF type:complete len:732 (+),score=218.50 TRINITY_DN10278_c0_g1_i1:78-2273(+)
MRIAVQGCCNGDLDRIYDAVRKLEKQGVTIDLLICCGDFQSVRDDKDLDCMWTPPQHKDLKDFHKYYNGQKQAPVTTVFVGGKNEASNLLREHYFGGWVAPKIYYMGCAGVVRVGPLRIAGISGHFSSGDYFRGHHECPPYSDEFKRSAFHVREWDVSRLARLQEPVDIVVSYDWPRGIWKFGNYELMFEQQDLSGDLKREMDGNTLGSPAAMELLKKLRPPFWFAANLQVKFPALVPHGDGTFTRFLALDRCKGGREFLQVMDIDPTSPSCLKRLPEPAWQGNRWPRRSSMPLCYDPEWLALQKVNHESMSFSWQAEKAKLVPPSKDDIAWVAKRLKEKVGSVHRLKDASKRHPNLLPTKLRQSSDGGFRSFSTLQLRELYETRGLEFPGHLDKASMIKQLEEFDEFFAEEGGGDDELDKEAYPIPNNFSALHSNPAAQRTAILEILELHDVWKDQEAQRRELTKGDQPEEVYDPFSEDPALEEKPTAGQEEEEDGCLEQLSIFRPDAYEEAKADAPEEQAKGEGQLEGAEASEEVGDLVEEQGDCEAAAAIVPDEPPALHEAEVDPAEEPIGDAAMGQEELDASAEALAAAVMGLDDTEEPEAPHLTPTAEEDNLREEQVRAAYDAAFAAATAAGLPEDDARGAAEAAAEAARSAPVSIRSQQVADEPQPVHDSAPAAEEDTEEAAGFAALALALAEAEGEEAEEAEPFLEPEQVEDPPQPPPKRKRRF